MGRSFGVLILTHGRPGRVLTYDALKKYGYTGPVFIVIDDEDKSGPRYKERFPGIVRAFSKSEIAKHFDEADNFQDRRAIVYARNASWDIAMSEGLTHFVQLDDDYTHFMYRFNGQLNRAYVGNGDCIDIGNLDAVFSHMCDFIDETGLLSVAMAQGGDFLGGEHELLTDAVSGEVIGKDPSNTITYMRKAMNSFVCRTDRRFWFVGRINEDVNTYTYVCSTGALLGTTNQVSLTQQSTQNNAGGMTDIYKSFGTYVKSFYSVMFHPSAVTVQMMKSEHERLHHRINWNCAVPKIVSEALRRV